MRLVRSVVLATAIATCLGVAPETPAQSASATSRHKQVDRLFQPPDGKPSPGCAVGISKDGALDYARGYGMSNLEQGVPMAPDTVLHVGSIAKQFTAFSIGLLAQEGKLSLDDDVRKYVPEMPDYGKTITLAHLVHHTNGLREQGQLLNLAGWRGDDVYTEADILRVLSRQRQLNFAPGTEVVYGNAAYTLLGLVVKRVSGKPLREFAQERIFEPLGMTDSRFRDDHTALVPRRSPAYVARAGGGWDIAVPNIDHYGSTSLLTTVGDLLKWEQNLVDARVGGPALIKWMETSGVLNDGTPIEYGAGLRLGSYRGVRMVSHDGADGGYRADSILFPDQRLAIVALCNAGGSGPNELVRKVADIYLGDSARGRRFAPPVAMPEAEQSVLAGAYWSPLTDEVVRLEWKDGALRQVDAPTVMVPVGKGVFRLGESQQEWRFKGSELTIRDFWPTTRGFVRITDPLPGPEALAVLAGDYRSEETEMTYTVRVEGGKLRLTWPRAYDLTLEAVGGDRFIGSRGTVTFAREASGEVTGLTISNRRLRRLAASRVDAES
ncbi:serine hydrolase [Luteibacter sp. NPDC031894]|uniref:serine hydrolase n=1 Tax=Luteibacter sp. NPDC031894 TaxID=3390572 RepID=UPI003D049B6A